MPVDQRLVSKLSVYLIQGLFVMKSSFTFSQITLIILWCLLKIIVCRVVGEPLASRVAFPSSLCSDKAREWQSVGELGKSQGLPEERGHGKCQCFADGAWDWGGEGPTSQSDVVV